MNKERTKHEQVNDPEYERRFIQAVTELKKVMHGVTGYIGAVDGWNEGKKQELKDRKRYDI